ncbi:hypothetical protein H5410_013466 [Solanum commersonii]|uniref:Uncharacterized protein n=1 Tax=Solanum commersonii TaxID=4109 RepID=A0A9J6AUQ3_SOLCO|nr:hypothetical protein H5410_013466 [Solanum commersonii]
MSSSFNFSIPPPDETPSTPVCGVGQTVESTTPFTEVKILPCSPTLVLFSEKSKNSEAQSVTKAIDGPSTKEVDVASRGVSSAMSERFFEGDLPKGRGPESSILAAGDELVAAQSLTSLRGYVQLNSSEPDDRSHEHVPLSLEPIFDQTAKSFDIETEKEKEEPP